MPKYQPGDVKAEFKDEATRESEWIWVLADSCDDEEGLVFGRLENERCWARACAWAMNSP